MPTKLKMWQIENDHPVAVEETAFASERRESDLERWIVEQPDLLGEDLLIISQQKEVDGVGRLDLLAIDEQGKLVIIELKRDKAPREVVAQALDYASWVDSLSEEEVKRIAENFLEQSLDDAFSARFPEAELPAISPQSHRILIVAACLNDSAERIINYLVQRHGVGINAVFFNYAKLANNTEILSRSILVPDAIAERGKGLPRITLDEINEAADHRKVLPLIAPFREILVGENYVSEVVSGGDGGSLKYMRKGVSGRLRLAVRLNVCGDKDSVDGQLLLQFRPPILSDILGISEDEARRLTDTLPGGGSYNRTGKIFRLALTDPTTAKEVALRFREWFQTYLAAYAPDSGR
jgi:hypothetical protein